MTYGLRPVPARTVLERVSVPVERTDDPSAARRIVERGNATVDRELAAPGRVVAVDGSYYVFDLDRAVTPRGGNAEVFVTLGAIVGLALGLWSLRRGWVHYDRWRGDGRPDGRTGRPP